MREIKFRAWEVDYKEMKYDVCFHFPNELNIDFMISWEEGFVRKMKSDVKLMQFTGLKDKNGKEIYEGDILLFPKCYRRWKEEKIKVEYEDYGFFPFTEITTYDGDDESSAESEHTYQNFECEVIGNIYENPDLLEPKSEVEE